APAAPSPPSLPAALPICSALHRDVPVVLLTGSEHAEEHARAVRAGADDVLPRPLERHTLLEVARRLLDENERRGRPRIAIAAPRSEEHTSELQSREKLVC